MSYPDKTYQRQMVNKELRRPSSCQKIKNQKQKKSLKYFQNKVAATAKIKKIKACPQITPSQISQ